MISDFGFRIGDLNCSGGWRQSPGDAPATASDSFNPEPTATARRENTNIEHSTSNIQHRTESCISNPKSEIRNPKFPRRGVTLMEVLISAGVTAVGLFGVIALVPLAAVQVGKGVIEDRKAILGKSMASEFQIRGCARPENWIFGNGTPVWNPALYPSTPFAPPGVSFCIDPRFVITNGASTFPYPPAATAASLAMPRVNLRAAPFDPKNPATLAIMNAQLADEIFVSQDDLEFLIPPGDRTQPPFQQFYPYNPTAAPQPDPIKRQSAGNYSWMATVVPKHGTVSDEYVLSIIIFYKRDPAMLMNDTATASSPKEVNERVVSVSAFSGAGVGGGDVTLQSAAQLDLEEIPQNSWIMLAGQTSTAAGNPAISDFKWFRIIGADDVTGAGPFTRALTLQGADWQRPEWTGGVTPTQATIVTNVVGVFERTMRLETSSLWTQ